MTITISAQAYDELFQEAEATATSLTEKDHAQQWDWICLYPPTLGQGLMREIQLHKGLWLTVFDYQPKDDLLVIGGMAVER